MAGKVYEINYLEDSDFDSSGKFKHPGNWVVFIYGEFCPHCHKVMPVIQQLVRENKSVNWAAIQTDGRRDSERSLANRLHQIVAPAKFRGVPMIISIKNGGTVKEYTGDRSKASIQSFIMAR
jgi:thiol-disulfide isomerase/thioredoxin